MNLRIRELAKQAGVTLSSFQFSGTPSKYEVAESELEKFAQLIVRECANKIDYWESRQGEHSDDLLKHFGIKE